MKEIDVFIEWVCSIGRRIIRPIMRWKYHEHIILEVGQSYLADSRRYYVLNEPTKGTIGGPATYVLKIDSISADKEWFTYSSKVKMGSDWGIEWEEISKERSSTVIAFKDEIMWGHLKLAEPGIFEHTNRIEAYTVMGRKIPQWRDG